MNQKPLKLIICIILILISLSFVVLAFIDSSKDNNDINDNNNVINTVTVDNDLEYFSDVLKIKANLKGYTALSKEEMIDKYSLDDNYYNEDNIKKLLKKGDIYYDLDAYNKASNTSITLFISKSNYSSYKPLLSRYSDKILDTMAKSYEEEGYLDVSINTYTIDFLDNPTLVLKTTYKDSDDNPIYQYSVYILNNGYLGTLNITSINNDTFNEIIDCFELLEVGK